jgi:hypothetical protein
MAALGIAANVGFILLLVKSTFDAWWAYKDLLHDPKAYGRVVTPELIATLKNPVSLWIAAALFALGAAFGIWLALHLLITALQLNEHAGQSLDRMRCYRRWKLVGITITVTGCFWLSNENFSFWVTATRHIPTGSGGPLDLAPPLAILAFGLVPWWHVGRCTKPGARTETVIL